MSKKVEKIALCKLFFEVHAKSVKSVICVELHGEIIDKILVIKDVRYGQNKRSLWLKTSKNSTFCQNGLLKGHKIPFSSLWNQFDIVENIFLEWKWWFQNAVCMTYVLFRRDSFSWKYLKFKNTKVFRKVLDTFWSKLCQKYQTKYWN